MSEVVSNVGRSSVIVGEDGRVYLVPARLRSEFAKALEDEQASDYSVPGYVKEISSLKHLTFLDPVDGDPRK